MSIRVTTTDFRKNLVELIELVRTTNEAIVIVKNGQPQAVMMSMADYAEFQALLNKYQDSAKLASAT